MYPACDFSGIQRYVLGVKTAGKAQAKRLRARSFLIELFEHAALWTIRESFGVSNDDVLVSGGGGFLVRLPNDADYDRLNEVNAELQRRLWDASGGDVQLLMGWADKPSEARVRLEYQKRRAAASILQSEGLWNPDILSQPTLNEPCDVCGQSPGLEKVQDEDEEAAQLHCRSCLNARSLGRNITRWEWMLPGVGSEQALGVAFKPSKEREPEAFRAGRWIPQSPRGEPLTFEDIANKSRGIRRLAVLKADVDDMGKRVGEIVGDSPTDCQLRQLRSFSGDLDRFFGETIQDLMRKSWPMMYTIYSGGDDLLLVGPWNVALDFVGELRREFEAGPGDKYDLTFSAGIALTPYRVPIRHAVERAERLESEAKKGPKNRCAALDTVWSWDRHRYVIGVGKGLANWVKAEQDAVPRALLHRLLGLIQSTSPMRAARWSYQIGRNAPRGNSQFRRWADYTLECLQGDEQRTHESAASIRYALLATRNR